MDNELKKQTNKKYGYYKINAVYINLLVLGTALTILGVIYLILYYSKVIFSESIHLVQPGLWAWIPSIAGFVMYIIGASGFKKEETPK